MSSLMVAAGVALGGLGIPSYMDLERHYHELGEQKRRWEEMMERTDRLMAGMKRTLDEMKGLVAQGVVGSPVHHVQHQPMQGQQQQQQQQGQQQPGSQHQSPQIPSAASPVPPAGAAGATTSTTTPAAAQAVPLNRTEKEKSGPSIWPVVVDASGAAGKP
jgi:transcription initiation factor TFIID subunit TAF12